MVNSILEVVMRKMLKKIIYRIAGPKGYEKAYVRGKIADIKNQNIDEPELAFLSDFIHEDSVVLDLGANYGHYTVEMAKRCPRGKVFAFEPIPFTYRVLEQVVSHFKLNNVALYNRAVSDQEGELNMVLPLLDFGGPNTGVAYIGESNQGPNEIVNIQTIPIDSLSISGKVDFIKIDIEGHEPKAFKGMENLIRANNPIILIEFSHNCLKRANQDPETFATYIKHSLNYQFARIHEGRLKEVPDLVPRDGYYFLLPADHIIEVE